MSAPQPKYERNVMTFETLFPLIVTVIAAIAAVLSCWYAYRADERSKRVEKEIKQAEWSLARPDYDEWLLERKGPGKIKVYGYSFDRFSQPYNSITHRFTEPQIFVEGSKWGIREELDGEDWDFTVYFDDVDHNYELNPETFPKDANKWVSPVA